MYKNRIGLLVTLVLVSATLVCAPMSWVARASAEGVDISLRLTSSGSPEAGEPDVGGGNRNDKPPTPTPGTAPTSSVGRGRMTETTQLSRLSRWTRMIWMARYLGVRF